VDLRTEDVVECFEIHAQAHQVAETVKSYIVYRESVCRCEYVRGDVWYGRKISSSRELRRQEQGNSASRSEGLSSQRESRTVVTL